MLALSLGLNPASSVTAAVWPHTWKIACSLGSEEKHGNDPYLTPAKQWVPVVLSLIFPHCCSSSLREGQDPHPESCPQRPCGGGCLELVQKLITAWGHQWRWCSAGVEDDWRVLRAPGLLSCEEYVYLHRWDLNKAKQEGGLALTVPPPPAVSLGSQPSSQDIWSQRRLPCSPTLPQRPWLSASTSGTAGFLLFF